MLFVAALSASATASATHYYGELRGIITNNASGGDAEAGLAVYVETESLTANAIISFCPYFVTHEAWFDLSDTPGSYWVEVGFVDGEKSGGQTGCANTQPFWADSRNGGGYHEHYPSYSWNYGTWYQLWIEEGILACSYTVNIGSAQLGTSTSNCPVNSGRTVTVGIETDDRSANNWAKGSAWDWARKDSVNNWLSGWGNTFRIYADYPSIRFDPNYGAWPPNYPYGTVTDEVLNVSY